MEVIFAGADLGKEFLTFASSAFSKSVLPAQATSCCELDACPDASSAFSKSSLSIRNDRPQAGASRGGRGNVIFILCRKIITCAISVNINMYRVFHLTWVGSKPDFNGNFRTVSLLGPPGAGPDSFNTRTFADLQRIPCIQPAPLSSALEHMLFALSPAIRQPRRPGEAAGESVRPH
eukprot:1188922-Pyramimonas_sp.AAC.1